MKNKFCPLIKAECRSDDCAWWREGDEDCTISVIGCIAVAEYNDYFDEKELQENLYKKDDKKELPN